MRPESGMAMMEEEVSRIDALQKEGEVRAATDAEIQEVIDREDARDHMVQTLDAYLEKAARRAFGLDKRAIDKEIQREVDAKHIPAEELNLRYDLLRDSLNQAYETFKQAQKNSTWAKGSKGTNGYIHTDAEGKPTGFSWEYKDPELEKARQDVLLAKTNLEHFVNDELYEGSEKTYQDSTKGKPFSEHLRDIDIIGLE